MKSTPSDCRVRFCFGLRSFVGLIVVCLAGAGCTSSEVEPEPRVEEPDASVTLTEALSFHASFDAGPDADFGAGVRSIYSAPSYQESDDPTPGIHVPDVAIEPEAGRFGSALRFGSRNTQALFYPAKDNVPYSATSMAGTVSFWLSLDPAVDLEPGFCDPIQITDVAYNDSAVWVDFTSENPRQFRLGVFGDLNVWNADNLPPGENPYFEDRLVVVNDLPFASGQWTHVVITYSGLNSPDGGSARLYLNAELQGTSGPITEPYTWDIEKAAIRLGVNYTGLYDDLSIFSRDLSDEEVSALHRLETGVAALYR